MLVWQNEKNSIQGLVKDSPVVLKDYKFMEILTFTLKFYFIYEMLDCDNEEISIRKLG